MGGCRATSNGADHGVRFMLTNRKEFAEVLGALVPGKMDLKDTLNKCDGHVFKVGGVGGDPEIRVMEEIFDRPFELWDVDRGADEPANIHLEGSLRGSQC